MLFIGLVMMFVAFTAVCVVTGGFDDLIERMRLRHEARKTWDDSE